MIGQANLINNINKYTIDTFPRSTLLLGEKGCGKHTLVTYIQQNIIKLPLLDITDNVSAEYIDAIYRNPNPTIYIIDLNEFTEKEQNILLKFVEEPLLNSFLILLSESKTNILTTVINRCNIFEFEQYTNDQLYEFLETKEESDLVLKVLRTPGKIKNTNLNTLKEMKEVCDKIVLKLDQANYSNALTIGNKINYKDEYNKFDIDVFFDMLSFSLFNNYLNTNSDKTYRMYLLTINSRKKLIDKRINKEYFMQNFLTKLWKESKL